jgi:predicted dehydrogenase/threonine dehydrogenase-like Zn-dependent dehydrogenase
VKQVALRLRDGRVEILEVPPPSPTPECVLVDVRASVLSVGTERSKIEAGREGLIGKARARPDQARAVIEKARRDGVRDTVQGVRTRLGQPTALGYSAAGVVLEVGARVRGLAPGDRVACGGGEYAVHADIVRVPRSLCVRLPDDVSFEAGAFATIASVAMHGVRQADVRLGERVAVVGLGLVGQLTGQILRAAGCHVIGIDLSRSLVDKGLELRSIDDGYEREVFSRAQAPTAATGCDAVVVTAATRSSDPIDLAARLLRDRGRVVVVGDVRVDVPRGPYYEREIDLRFSRSYGPGRYDREYEERGLDYPIGYVRWTEQRNMDAFVALLASGRVDVSGLILDRLPVDEAPAAYERLATDHVSPLGIVVQYAPTELPLPPRSAAVQTRTHAAPRTVNVIGAGSFAQRILIPGLRKAGFTLGAVASSRGLSAKGAGERFEFSRTVSPEEALADPGAGLIAIATRHASHAGLVEGALRADKAVFVEKPPCLSQVELAALRAARADSGRRLDVGFNRRHAPLARAVRDHVLHGAEPIELIYRVNAGRLPPAHWLNDPEDGGGRLLGEGCHFVDFACWLIGSSPATVACVSGSRQATFAESFAISLGFPNGSIATISYAVGGAERLGKEYVEAHSGGRSACLDDYRTLTTYDGKRRHTRREREQDKGHFRQFVALASDLEVSPAGEFDPLDSMAATLAAYDSMRGTDHAVARPVRRTPAGVV